MVVKRPISHSDPAVSVVIPTIPDYELKTLSALQNQTEDRFEVVVVSDASLNRCEARNKGIEEANADVIAQTDDDCFPPDDWVERIRTFFHQNPNKVLLEGPLDKFQAPPRHYIGANISYRRKQALDVGGFDSTFAGWRADTDFGWRMEDQYGAERCHYDRDLEVVHDGPMRTNVDRDKEQAFRLRHPQKYFRIIFPKKVVFGRYVGIALGICYSLSPRLGESIFIKGKNLIR